MAKKEYLVTAIEKILTTYTVPADSEEEAREKIANREPNDGIVMSQEEYYDLDYITEVVENV